MSFYDNVDQLRKVFIEKNNMLSAQKTALPGSWTAYKQSKERIAQNERIQNMPLSELLDMCLYYNIENINHSFFVSHPEICERYSQGTLDERFVSEQKNRHRTECLPYTFIEIPTVVKIEALSKSNRNDYTAVLSDPYGSICATIKEDINPKRYLGRHILANICYSSITETCVTRTRILDAKEDQPY